MSDVLHTPQMTSAATSILTFCVGSNEVQEEKCLILLLVPCRSLFEDDFFSKLAAEEGAATEVSVLQERVLMVSRFLVYVRQKVGGQAM